MYVIVHNPSNNATMFEGELVELLDTHGHALTLRHVEKIVQGLYLTGRYVGTISDVWIEITCYPVPHWLGGITVAGALQDAIHKADMRAGRTTDGPTLHVTTSSQPSDDVQEAAKDEQDSEWTPPPLADEDIPF